MVLVKERFIGRDRYAVMVLPPRGQHVNIHAHCFHWWDHVRGPSDRLPDLHDIEWESAV